MHSSETSCTDHDADHAESATVADIPGPTSHAADPPPVVPDEPGELSSDRDVPAAGESSGAKTVADIPVQIASTSCSGRDSSPTTFASLIHVPVRSRSERKRKSLPSFRLTSPEHFDVVHQRQMKMGKRKTMDDESPKSHGRVTARKEKASKVSKRSRTPKNDKGAKSTSKGHREVEVDNTHCLFCKKCFSSPEDDKPNDDWLRCASCNNWAHETCAETWGVIGDDDYLCKSCL